MLEQRSKLCWRRWQHLNNCNNSRNAWLATLYVGILPRGLGARNASPPHENEKSRNALLAIPSAGISPQGLGMCNVSPPRENDYSRSRNALLVTPPLGITAGFGRV